MDRTTDEAVARALRAARNRPEAERLARRALQRHDRFVTATRASAERAARSGAVNSQPIRRADRDAMAAEHLSGGRP
jgi:hypothetical protein